MTPDRNTDQYPYKLYRPEACMGIAVQQSWEDYQLKCAVLSFKKKIAAYYAQAGSVIALSIEQKKSLMPYLTLLAECGWPSEQARAVIETRSYDTKSLQDAHIAYKSIADFALNSAGRDVQAMHIALHHIGNVIETAFSKNNPWHKPAGSPNSTGGQFDHSPENGGAGHRGGGATHPRESHQAPPAPLATQAVLRVVDIVLQNIRDLK